MFTRKIVVYLLLFYKKLISPIIETLFGKACLYEKTCSEYAIEAINREGVLVGGKKALVRFMSCNPWSFSSR